MPNHLRGMLVRSYKHLFHGRSRWSGVLLVIFVLEVAAFFECLRTLDRLENHGQTGRVADMMNYNRMLRNQRDAFTAGFGIFMQFVAWRLMELMRQLYDERALYKQRGTKAL